ncbi:hypothetical protein ACN47E_008231 [Coniothyrium glycines]
MSDWHDVHIASLIRALTEHRPTSTAGQEHGKLHAEEMGRPESSNLPVRTPEPTAEESTPINRVGLHLEGLLAHFLRVGGFNRCGDQSECAISFFKNISPRKTALSG